MRLWKILLALLLALTGSSPSALASIPLAQENPCTGPFRGVVSGLRYYNPAQGRFVGRDPAGEEGGVNLFAFCYNNGITGCDPFGKNNLTETAVAAGEGASLDGSAGAAANLIVDQAEAANAATFISEDTELIEGEQAINSGDRTYKVYQATQGGNVNYVGITSRDVETRAAEHLFERESLDGINGLNTLSKADARAVEQTLIDTLRGGGNLLNKINSISPTSDPEYYINSIFRGLELLQQAGYPGF